MKTLIGLIPDEEHVAHAREALQATGIGANDITAPMRPAQVWKRLGGRKKLPVALKYTLAGGALGLLVGALYGIPATIFNCSEVGCPFMTSTALLVVIVVYWVIGGLFMGAIVGMDRLEQDLYSYVEGVRRGSALIIVQTPDDRATDVTRILQEDRGLLVHSLEAG